MQPCEESSAWVILTRAPALDIPSLMAALAIFGTAQELIRAGDARRERARMPSAARHFLASTKASLSPAERSWLQNSRHHVVPFTDPRYPVLLRAAGRCPVALYVAGNVDVLNDPQLAIVGSRNPTPQGMDTAHEIAGYLAERGLVITSGLAEGIDSAAHRGAIQARGVTLAVLGSGVDVVYPRSNAHLGGKIQERGALLSGFPLGTAPRPHHFPQRNGTIAGLSLGTLVVEAALRSGSLITARLAGELGRELFAIPGSIHSPLSRGCHELIRQGAKLTETPHDILSELNFSPFFAGQPPSAAPCCAAQGGDLGMDKDHKILLDALGFDPADLDTLVVRTGFKPEAVSSMMLILELEGHVQTAPGGRYSRVVRSRR